MAGEVSVPFDDYQGMELNEVPVSYLRWLRSQSWVGGWLVQATDRLLENKVEEDEDVMEAFSVITSNDGSQSIIDPDGQIVVWTTDPWMSQVVCKLL